MATQLSVKDIKIALNGMVQRLCKAFGEGLVAIVVYGSYAQGTAQPASDVDLLVVVKELPRNWESIHRLEDEWARQGRQFGKRFQVMLASPEDVEDSVKGIAPLMLEIYKAHKVVFDSDNFFRDWMLRMKHLISDWGIRMRKPGVWEVPEHVISP
jgi:predicted nucleotidyltransferase